MGNRVFEDVSLKDIYTPENINMFWSAFGGRPDVFASRSARPNTKTGMHTYYPDCENKWHKGICNLGKGAKCSECRNRAYKRVTVAVLRDHLAGNASHGDDAVAIYPFREDGTCCHIVFDFDDRASGDPNWGNPNDSYMKEIRFLQDTLEELQINYLTERTRSGAGAHIWVLFSAPVSVSLARQFAMGIITYGMQKRSLETFALYDRIIPEDNALPKGGLGTAVPLPLQGQALREGNTAFVDRNFVAYADQWKTVTEFIREKRLSPLFIESKVRWFLSLGIRCNFSDIIPSQEDEDSRIVFDKSDTDGIIDIRLTSGIELSKEHLSPRIQNQLRRLATFYNDEYYSCRSMGYSTVGIPHLIYDGADKDEWIWLPRGLYDRLINKLWDAEIDYEITNERSEGTAIDVEFKGKLTEVQELAIDSLKEKTEGVIAVSTGVGKTVAALNLISRIKKNVVILVPTTQLLDQWVESIERFLVIKTPIPQLYTKSGREKKRTHWVGTYRNGKNEFTGIIDVALMSSVGRDEEVMNLVKKCGIAVIDEAHHVVASQASNAIKAIAPKYIFGFTATPQRSDGREPREFFLLGPIRYTFTTKERLSQQSFEHLVRPRFTNTILPDEAEHISAVYRVLEEDRGRTELIIQDTIECVKNGRSPLVLTSRIAHAKYLYERLKDKAAHVFLLTGEAKTKDRIRTQEEIANVAPDESLILIGIAALLGEGFSVNRLDILQMALPVKWEGLVEQYAGRLHRDYQGKEDIIVYDYVDQHIPVMNRMFSKRLPSYKRMGYTVWGKKKEEWLSSEDAIRTPSNFGIQFEKDVLSSQQECLIASSYITRDKASWLIDINARLQGQDTRLTVLTMDPASNKYGSSQSPILDSLTQNGIRVIYSENDPGSYAVIDGRLVWTGTINYLSTPREDDIAIRYYDEEAAAVLTSENDTTERYYQPSIFDL